MAGPASRRAWAPFGWTEAWVQKPKLNWRVNFTTNVRSSTPLGMPVLSKVPVCRTSLYTRKSPVPAVLSQPNRTLPEKPSVRSLYCSSDWR